MKKSEFKKDNLTYFNYCKVAYYRTLNRLQLLYNNKRISKELALSRAKNCFFGLELDRFNKAFK